MSFADAKAAGKLVFGQLPVLDADGVLIAQSGSQNRLVAAIVGEKKPGFYPSDPVKLAVADMLHETHQVCALARPSELQILTQKIWCSKLPSGYDLNQLLDSAEVLFPIKRVESIS